MEERGPPRAWITQGPDPSDEARSRRLYLDEWIFLSFIRNRGEKAKNDSGAGKGRGERPFQEGRQASTSGRRAANEKLVRVSSLPRRVEKKTEGGRNRLPQSGRNSSVALKGFFAPGRKEGKRIWESTLDRWQKAAEKNSTHRGMEKRGKKERTFCPARRRPIPPS